jgi:hypothetical protein
MPAYAQRSPSEALSPSAGPYRDRPTAISSDVWLVPSYTGTPGRPQSASEQLSPSRWRAVGWVEGALVGGWRVG